MKLTYERYTASVLFSCVPIDSIIITVFCSICDVWILILDDNDDHYKEAALLTCFIVLLFKYFHKHFNFYDGQRLGEIWITKDCNKKVFKS